MNIDVDRFNQIYDKREVEGQPKFSCTPEDYLYEYLDTFGTLTYKECYAIIEWYLTRDSDYTFSPAKIGKVLQRAIIINCKTKMRAIYNDDLQLIGKDTLLYNNSGRIIRGMTPYLSITSDAVWPFLALARKKVKLLSVMDEDHNETEQALLKFPNQSLFSICRLYPEERAQTNEKLDFFLEQKDKSSKVSRVYPLFYTLGKTLGGLEDSAEYLFRDEFCKKYQSMTCIVMSLNYNAKVGFQFREGKEAILDPNASGFWFINHD